MSQFINAIKSSKLIKSLESKRVTKKGKVLDVWLTVTKLEDQNGNLNSIATTERDITERIKTIEELKKSYHDLKLKYQEKLETIDKSTEKLREENIKIRELEKEISDVKKLSALGKLAGILGHELRNPISAIRHSIYYLKEFKLKEKKVNKHLDLMQESSFEAQRVINDILLFAKVQNPRRVNLEVNKAIKEIISRSAIPKNVKVILKLKKKPLVLIDQLHLNQAIRNVISNAVFAMPEGGTITIGSDIKDKKVHLEISNTGKEIPKKNLSKIFHPLFTTHYKGTGLGLPVCQHVLSLHNATIEVKNIKGYGVKFIIKIPTIKTDNKKGEKK
jgi:signal transduction histidine kinase